jgi:hypothetical protein
MNKQKLILEDGIRICRMIEQTIAPLGYHCALGGSLMYRGYSSKDIDVIIYPRNNNPTNIIKINKALRVIGFEHTKECQTASAAPGQNVFPMYECDTGIRVDIFYMERCVTNSKVSGGSKSLNEQFTL